MSIKTTTKRVVRREISRLRTLERRCAASRHRFAFYHYLQKALELYERLRRTGRVRKWCDFIKTQYAVSYARQADLMRLLIEATSDADHKSKSRWARGLRFAWKSTGTSAGVVEFLKANGGPAGCADKYATFKPTGMRKYVRFHSAGQVWVPFFVHPDCYPRNRALHPI